MLSKEEVEGYCRAYYSLVFKYCMSQLYDKVDTEDATQETFVIFSIKGHLLDPEYVKPWLLTTAHHMVLKEYRRRAVEKDKKCYFSEEMMLMSRKVKSFEESLIDCYADKYVEEVYSRLSEKEKELFDLCSDGTLKTGEIAQILGIEPHTCSMRKQRLKEKCREIMLEILFY